MPGDSKTEPIHVNYSSDRVGTVVGRRITDVAVQLRVGLLPKRRLRSGGCDCAYFGIDGPGLALA